MYFIGVSPLAFAVSNSVYIPALAAAPFGLSANSQFLRLCSVEHNRKNWLFCDIPNGAQASAIVYTMVEMAKVNGVNVYHYLTYLLEKLPNDRMSDEELELLAPWNENVKAEIKRRASGGD